MTLYSISKYGNIVFSNELAKRYADQGIVSTAVHPGSIETDITQHMNPWAQRTLKFLLYYPIQYGVLMSLWAGTSPKTRDLNGKWLIPWVHVGKMGPSKDPQLREKLWEWIEEQRKGHY
ncbi:hypothetical protein FRB94_006030 [Tulasnella sp. JGI-2019a]|nr:hypothetical protein FRB94_006030 [Tulasnella sp. JGI-2019a]